MADYVTDAEADAFRDNPRLSVFFRIGLSGDPLCLWAGVGHCPAEMFSLAVGEEIYLGAGELLNIPELGMMMNGVAERVDFTLSGVSDETLDLINNSEVDVVGRRVHVGIGVFDEDYQLVSTVKPIWFGRGDVIAWSSEARGVNGRTSNVLSYSVASGDTGRARPKVVYWTSAHHQLVYPGENFFDMVFRLQRSHRTIWPRW